LQDRLSPSSYAGWRATMTCSAVFVAGRDLESVLADELAGMPLKSYELPAPQIDDANRAALNAYAAGQPPRLSVYRPGMGCTNMPPGATAADVPSLPAVDMPMPSGDPAHIAWPDGDLMLDSPPPPSVDTAELTAVVEAAFDGETFGGETKTIGVAIVYDGRLVAERYRPGFGPHTQYRTWSAAKSITNALVGILVGQGKLHVKSPAPIPAWQSPGDPRSRITIGDLLHMSSGLQTEGAEAYRVYFDGGTVDEELAAAKLEVEPGTRWHYANRDTLALMRAARQVIGDDEEYLTFPRRALLNKIGMRSTFPEVDAAGNFILSSQVWTTARDLARFGLLYLNDGVWGGERILPAGWVEYSQTPAPTRSSGFTGFLSHGMLGLLGYGAQFWLFDDVPFFPYHAYSAIGHRGQFVTVVPSHKLVIVRTGLDSEVPDVTWRQDRFIKAVVEAIS
jgi:CubicO group peptidase (beta-lactamase class C family)